MYGIPMTSMKKWISHEPLIRVVDPSLIVSKVAKLFAFDLQTVSYEEIIKIDRVFETELLGECKANGVVFWFEAAFEHGVEKKDIKASPCVVNWFCSVFERWGPFATFLPMIVIIIK